MSAVDIPAQSDNSSKYVGYPAPGLLIERLELRDSILYWRKEPLSLLDPTLSDLLAIPPSAAGRPASRSPNFSWFGTPYSTKAITWAVAYGRYPDYRLVLRQGPGSACNDLRNLMQVQPARTRPEPTYVMYFFQSGMVGAQVVPKVLRDDRHSQVSREVPCKLFPDMSLASAWAEQKKLELEQTETVWHRTERDRVIPPTYVPKPVQRYISLPALDEETKPAPSLDILELQCSTAPLPAFSAIKLDMLSFRACERFVGLAVNYSRENSGLLPDGKTPGALLTVTLGAVDGVWKAETIIYRPSDPPTQHTRSSQEAALAPFSVSAQVRVGRTPGGAARTLRMALLGAYRFTQPTTEDRRTALALLTPARIPVLGQSLAKKRPAKRLVPEGLPESAANIPLPIFLAELADGLDFRQYRPTNSTLTELTGLLLVVQRTRSGFLFRLHGGEKGLNGTERKEVRLIAQKLYPARVGAAAFRKIRTKTVYRGMMVSLEGLSKLAPLLADRFTSRLAAEHGWNIVKERKEKELHKKLPTLANREFASRGTYNTFMVLIDGTEMHLSEALKKYNHVVRYRTAWMRITRSGWTAKAAVSTPAHGRKAAKKPGPTPTPPSPGRPQTGS